MRLILKLLLKLERGRTLAALSRYAIPLRDLANIGRANTESLRDLIVRPVQVGDQRLGNGNL